MPNQLLLKAAENSTLERWATGNKLSGALVNRYVAGYTLDDALAAASALEADGIDVSLDLLGESVRDLEQSKKATEEYKAAIAEVAKTCKTPTVSVKLSQLGIMIDPQACEQNLRDLLEEGKEHGVGVEVDMEHSSVGRDTLAIYKSIIDEYPDTRQAIQSCMRATHEDLGSFEKAQPRIRLVKGAFDETFQVALQDHKEVTEQYNFYAQWALENLPDPAFGTHDDVCIDVVKKTASRLGIDKKDFEFQMLFGVRRDVQKDLVRQGYRVRVYLPYGNQWYPYLMRRMAERPANLLMFLRSLIGG